MGLVDAQAVLTDLLEVSGQVEVAAIVTREGELMASTMTDDDAIALGASVHRLASTANAIGSPTDQDLLQLQVTLQEECVFVAQDADHAIGCVTVPHPTAGLVFYDLKSTLRRLAGDADELVPKPMAWEGTNEEGGETSS